MLALCLLLLASPVRVEDSGQLRSAVARAKPGAVISLEPGKYEPGVRLVGVAGTKARPIVIEGNGAHFHGGTCALHLVDCRFVTVRKIKVSGCSGNGINVDDGGSIETPSIGIVLDEISVLDTGPRGNHDGIKLSGVDDFAVRRCRIEGWGGSAIDMVGCHRGVIEDCRIEGKPGFSQSSGVQMKGGCKEILVHRCFFRDAGHRSINCGGSTGVAYFRPADARWEAEAITIAGNRFVGSHAPVAFVNSDRARVHHNTIYEPGKWVLRILQESRGERFPPCRGGIFESNLIVYDRRVRTPVNVGPGTAPETFVYRRNAWFGVEGARVRTPGKDAIQGIDPKLASPGTPDMRATAKRLGSIGAGGYRPR